MTQTATTLAASITAATEHLTLAAPLSDDEVDGFYVQIGTELMEVLYRGTKTNPGVRRGRLGTSPATHASSAAVTPVKVVVQTDAPTAPPPATAGGAAASVYFQEADPGAVGFGAFWIQINAGNGGSDYFQLLARNEANDAWVVVSAIVETDGATFTTIASPNDNIEIVLDEDGDEVSISGATTARISTDVLALRNEVEFHRGSADPTAGGGVAAPVRSLYFRDFGPGAGSLWLKTGAGDTAWSVFPALTAGSFTAPGSLSLNATTNALLVANGGAVEVIAIGNLVKLTGTGLTLNDLPIGTQAAHVADGSTVDQLRNALIASGLMAAS